MLDASLTTNEPSFASLRRGKHEWTRILEGVRAIGVRAFLRFVRMRTIIVTGSAGLIGSETVKRFAKHAAGLIAFSVTKANRSATTSTASILVEAFAEFIRAPCVGEVYNIGGSRHSNCSMLEAIEMCEEISGKKLSWSYEQANRIGDHIWWISDVRKFQQHYPQWKFRYGMREILEEIHRAVARQVEKLKS